MMPLKPDVQEILVLETDPLCAVVIAEYTSSVFPGARIHCESDPAVAAVVLADRPVDLFIVAVRGLDLDVITLLGVWAGHDVERTKVLVVTPQLTSASLKAVCTLPIAGLLDWSCAELAELQVALRRIANGSTYWSRSVVTQRTGQTLWEPANDAAPAASIDEPPAYRRVRVRRPKTPRRLKPPDAGG